MAVKIVLSRRNKIILGVILPVMAAAIILGAFLAVSAYAMRNCIPSSCAIVESGGAKYRLTGDAYTAYIDLNNIAAPIHKMRFDSQYIGDRPYLINIDGPSSAVEEIVSKYNVIKNGTKVTADNRWTSFYGSIYKGDLKRFLDENSVYSLSSRSVSVSPVMQVTLEQGMTVKGIPPQIPDTDMKRYIADRQAFVQDETSKIITQRTGVERIWIG